MKILAIEKEIYGASAERMNSFLKDEAVKVLELFEAGFIREIYFHRDRHTAVIILECMDEFHAEGILNSLPLVKEKLIEFEISPLVPYTGFSRLL